MKSSKKADFTDIEEILFKWVVNARESNYILSDEIPREKARAIGQHLEQPLTGSIGWLQNEKTL